MQYIRNLINKLSTKRQSKPLAFNRRAKIKSTKRGDWSLSAQECGKMSEQEFCDILKQKGCGSSFYTQQKQLAFQLLKQHMSGDEVLKELERIWIKNHPHLL